MKNALAEPLEVNGWTLIPAGSRWWQGTRNGGVVTVFSDMRFVAVRGGTKYGFMSKLGPLWVDNDQRFSIREGMFFAAPGLVEVSAGAGFVVHLPDYEGILTIGGPVEEVGRLKYINGASDTLLVSPLKKGDPCMNFLHVPQGIDQQPHTHPSLRVGMILRGRGKAIVTDGPDSQAFNLEPGSVFVMDADTVHSFHTPDSFLDIVVVHPDSDFGPTDDEHPMLSKTMVDGVSAKFLDKIKTREILK